MPIIFHFNAGTLLRVKVANKFLRRNDKWQRQSYR